MSRGARAATWRDLADYERTWQANAEVATQAFTEIEPLVVKVRALVAERAHAAS